MAAITDVEDAGYPGRALGLPATGRGSLASWSSRIAALVLDWAVCMAIAVGSFGTGVLHGHGWRSWTILAVFFLQSAVLSWLLGGSLGQLICRIAVVRVHRVPLDLGRALLRSLLLCLALPPLIVAGDRRGLHDLAAGTVVVNRR